MDQTLLKILKIEASKTFSNLCKFMVVAFSSAICAICILCDGKSTMFKNDAKVIHSLALPRIKQQ